LLQELFVTDDVCASFLRCSVITFWCEYRNADCLTGTVWKAYCCTNVLVCLSWVNTEAYVYFNACIKLSWVCLGCNFECFSKAVYFACLNVLCSFLVLLTTALKTWTSNWTWAFYSVRSSFWVLWSCVASFFASFFFSFCFSFCE
jgi:hypothetical protein